MKTENVLITSSKDTFVKLWDLDTQHCFQTLVEHRSEVWSAGLLRDETRLVTASSDRELRIYDMKQTDRDSSSSGGEVFGPVTATFLGTIQRQATSKVLCVRTDVIGRHLVVMSGDSLIEVYNMRSDGEIDHVRKKRLKKARKKQKAGGEWVEPINTVSDELPLLHVFNSKSKMKSCDFSCRSNGEILLLLSLSGNMLELHTLTPSSAPSLIHSISHPGHRTDIRTVSLSSDGSLIASGSASDVKIWDHSTCQCLNTLASGYAVSSSFVPGDRHLLIGTKSGELQLFELSSSALIETFEAHSNSVSSIAMAPDRRGFVTGSADHDVKFWEFELMSDENNPGRKRLTAAHVKTLKMSEDVLCVKYSPDMKLLAVALLDCTMKVFYADTLKFFLSLYGHKLPVLTMDISSDSTLLVSGSSDKNIKIWGLDFGDCHRSIFAHDDNITAVQFVPGTHLLFSVSKDKTLKHWDADKFEHIQTLEGHQSEVWALAVSHNGDFVVTGSHDRSLRVWECTQEPLILSEERENEREAEFEKSVAEGGEHVIPGEQANTEIAMAGKKTESTIKGAELIMEAIEIYREEERKMAEHRQDCIDSEKELAPPKPHPIIQALGSPSPEKYVLSTVKKIRSSDLEEALVVLPFDFVTDFIKLCNIWLEKTWDVELVCRCAFFLLRVHHNQITSTHSLVPVIDSLRLNTRTSVDSLRDMYGLNLASMKYLEGELKTVGVSVFADISQKAKRVQKRKKRARGD